MSKQRPSRPLKVDRTVTRSSCSDDSTCTVCHESIEFFAIGHCDHPICYKCSTRMRVMCDQMYCAICRADIPKVAFIRRLEKFDHIKLDSFCINREKFIFFEDEAIRSAYDRLLENRCKLCKDLPNFPSFKKLESHINREHHLFCCDLCMENLKLFSCDRKFYDRKQLAEHKRHGDSNDTSYRLHPLCQFCDQRYFDNDELLRHLRKDHYYCHFCEADGINNEYFEEYTYLVDHFREKHFLCEEDECARTEFTNAFRSEIDLKAHVSTTHSKHLGRHQARQLRTIDIDINYGPRSQDGGRRNTHRHRGGAAGAGFEDRGGGRTRISEQRHREEQQKRADIDTAYAISLSLSEAQRQGSICVMDQQLAENSRLVPSSQSTAAEKTNFSAATDDFPSLRGEKQPSAKHPVQNGDKSGSKANTSSLAQVLALNTGRSVRSGRLDEADFPSLGGSQKLSGISKTKGSVWQQNGSQMSGSVSNLAEKKKSDPKATAFKSKEFESMNHASASEKATTAFRKSVTTPNFMDFPVLGTSSNKTQISGTWVKKKENVEPEQPPAQTERSGLLKLEVKNKGKQRRDNQPTVNAKQSKLEKSNASDKQNGEGDKSQEDQKNTESSEPVKSLADIASRLAGNSNLENEFSKKGAPPGVENAMEVSSTDKKKQKKSKAEKEPGSMLKEGKVTDKDLGKASSSQISSAVAKASGSRNATDEAAKSLHKDNTEQQLVNEKNSRDKKEKNRSVNVDGSEKNCTKKKEKLKSEEESKDSGQAEADLAELKFQPNEFPKLISKQKGVNSKPDKLESKEAMQLRVDAPEFKMLWPCDTKDKSGISEKEKSTHSDKDLLKGAEAIKQEEKLVAAGKITSGDCSFKHATVSQALDSSESSDLISAESSLGNVHVSSESDPISAELYLESIDFQPKFAPSDFPSLMGSSANALLTAETIGINPLFISNNLSQLSTYPVNSQEYLASSALVINSDTCSSVPSLHLSTAPPPGFSSTTVKPPPGFSSKAAASKPPPGFTKPLISESDGVLNASADIATQNLCGVPATASFYIPPKRSQDRYAKLIANIVNETTDTTFDRFKEISLNFRQNHINAKEYYSQCSEVIGTEAFQKIFPELVVLLPNIEKQQELLSAHRAHISKSLSKKTNPWSTMDNEVSCCTFCGQVILNDDNRDHQMEHGNTDSKPMH